MILSHLLQKIQYQCIRGDVDIEVEGIVYDSRKDTSGRVFVCMTGTVFDGHNFAAEVAAKGARALVVSKEVELPEDAKVTIIKVEDTRAALAHMAAAWFGYPAEKMKIIGITGTKGKTTTTYLVKSILENAGYKVGLIGTIETIIGEEHIPAANTTPESYLLQQYFARMADAGMDCVVMEVSSQALKMNRTCGVFFDYGIFTNLEKDHIAPGEHESMEDYMACKGLLFRQCKVGIVNGDDIHLEQVLAGHTCEIETYGLKEGNHLRATDLQLVYNPGRLGVSFRVSGLMKFETQISTPGRFSVYNALTAIAICRHFRIEEKDITRALMAAKVKGRIEMVPVSDAYTLLIDYAHNAMSLESLLTTLREYNPGRLICLFGCGGNRSKDRRFEMGEISGKLADLTVITSDNPRYEEPMDIISDIKTGIGRTEGAYVEIPDRKEAIRYVMRNGRQGDIIVLAGKGHEDYQEIKGVKYPMDERVLIREILDEGL